MDLNEIQQRLGTEETRLAKVAEVRNKIAQDLATVTAELLTARNVANEDAENALLQECATDPALRKKVEKIEERNAQLEVQAAAARGAFARQVTVVEDLHEQIVARRHELLEAELAGPAIRARELVRELVTLTERITQIGRKYEVWDLSRLVFPEQAGGFVAVGLKMGVLESASALTALQAKYTIPII